MNTFSMKQWLVENKVGPYSKIHGDKKSNQPWTEDEFGKALYSIQMEPWKREMIDKAFRSHTGNKILDQYGAMDVLTAANTYVNDIVGKKKEEFSKWAYMDKTMDGWPLDERDPRDGDDDDFTDQVYDDSQDPENDYEPSFDPSIDEYSSGQDHIQYDDEPRMRMPFASEKPDPTKYSIQRDKDGKIISATNVPSEEERKDGKKGHTFKKGDTAKLQPQDHSRVIVINSFIEQDGKVMALYSVRGTPYLYDIDGLDPVNPKTNEQMGVGYVMKTKLSDPKY